MKKRPISLSFRLTASLVTGAFIFTLIVPLPHGYSQGISNLPRPGMRVPLSPGFQPPLLRGIKVFPDNPLRLNFIMDMGDADLDKQNLEQECTKLIKYFLAALTVPVEDLWVNLSPYEKDRIIPTEFGITQMGIDLLSQDYLLKQITASLIYPEEGLGKNFWEKVYSKVFQLYGTTQLPVNTFQKIWIVPQKAVVYAEGETAYVVESSLKVMLEEDYLALQAGLKQNVKTGLPPASSDNARLSSLSSQIVRDVLIPEIEKEVNTGKNFATLRQIYHALILATWFKRNLKESLLGKVYVDQKKVTGVDIADKTAREKIYQQYLEAFKRGVYNYIREEYDPYLQKTIPRKYFAGGFAGREIEEVYQETDNSQGLSSRGPAIEVASYLDRQVAPENRATQGGGLIGKYRPLTPIEFDRENKKIRFTGQHIETNETREIVLDVVKTMDVGDVSFPQGVYDHELTSDMISWFWDNFSEVMVIAQNPYDIHGLGSKDLIVVSEKFAKEGLAVLHEIGEAMGDKGDLRAEYVLSFVQDKSWYQSHIKKSGRQGMELHYALRALFRELFSREDQILTFAIKGRMTITEAMLFIKQQDRQLMYGSILSAFRTERQKLNNRKEEEALLLRLIAEERQRMAAERQEEQRRQEESAKQQLEEINQRERIREILPQVEGYLKDNKTEVALAVGSQLSGMNPQWLAGEAAVFIRNRLKKQYFPFSDSVSVSLLNLLLTHNRQAIQFILSELYPEIFPVLETGTSGSQTYIKAQKTLLEFLDQVKDLTLEEVKALGDFLTGDLVKYTSLRPFVTADWLYNVPDIESYFEWDRENLGIYHFPDDFLNRIKWARDLNLKKRLTQFYNQAHSKQSAIKEVYAKVLEKDQGKYIVQSLLAELKNPKLPARTRVFIISVLAQNARGKMSQEHWNDFTESILTALRSITDSSLRQDLIFSLGLLVHNQSLPQQQAVADLLKEQMAPFLQELTQVGHELQEADWAYREAAQKKGEEFKAERETTSKRARGLAKQQEKFMREMESRVRIFVSLAQKTSQSAEESQSQFSRSLLKYIIEVAKNDQWDINVAAEIISQFKDFIGLENETVITFFENELRKQISDDLFPLFNRALRGEPGPDTDTEVLHLLSQPNLDERIGYLVLLRQHTRKELLEKVIHQPGMDIRFKMYAFSWYATQFLDETTFSEMLDAIDKSDEHPEGGEIEKFVRGRAHDDPAMNELIDHVFLQDPQAQTYATATFALLHKQLRHVTLKGFKSVMMDVANTQIYGYFNNANSGFQIGGRMIKRVPETATLFFQIVAHELMHDILFGEYNYFIGGLKNAIVHELLCDIHAFILSRRLNLDERIFMDTLDFEEHFGDVLKDDLHTVEAHEGARAQLKVIEDRFKALGVTLDWENFLKAGIETIAEVENRDKPLEAIISLMISKYIGSVPQVEEKGTLYATGTTHNVSSWYEIESDFFGPPDTELKQKILGPEEIEKIVERRDAGMGTNNPGGIDLNPGMLDLQTQGKGLNFDIPFNPQAIQNIPIEGFTPIVFQITPVNLPQLLQLEKNKEAEKYRL